MTNHEKIYREFFGIACNEYAPCERCTAKILLGHWDIERGVQPQQDIHHVDCRGMGGDPTGSKDKIENLAGLCRSCHKIAEMCPQENELLAKWCAELETRKLVIDKFLYGEGEKFLRGMM